MGQFVQECGFKLGNPGHFLTIGEFVYHSDRYGNIIVPDGFSTDFASIPNWVPRWLFDPMRHARKSALPHDMLCRDALSFEDRVKADHVFYEAMGDEGVKQWRRAIMFSAVRLNTQRMKWMGEWR